MKKVAVLLGFLSVFSVGCVSYTPLDLTISKQEEVSAVKGDKNEVFANVIKFASTQRLRVDSSKVISDSATGVVAFSTGQFITDPDYPRWPVYVSYSVSVECRAGKIRVTVKNPMYENQMNAGGAFQPLPQLPYVNSEADAKRKVKLFNEELNKGIAKTKKELVDSLNSTSSF